VAIAGEQVRGMLQARRTGLHELDELVVTTRHSIPSYP
jgi:hypothetical protein